MTDLIHEAQFDQAMKLGLESFQDDSDWELTALEEVLDTADMLAPTSGFWSQWGLGLLPPSIGLLIYLTWPAMPNQSPIHHSIIDEVSYAVSEVPLWSDTALKRKTSLEPLAVQLQIAEIDRAVPLVEFPREHGNQRVAPEVPVELNPLKNQARRENMLPGTLDAGIIRRLEPIRIEQEGGESPLKTVSGHLSEITLIPMPDLLRSKPGILNHRRQPAPGFTVPGRSRMGNPVYRSSQSGRSPGRSHGMGGRSRGR